jgi:hypothetical protein
LTRGSGVLANGGFEANAEVQARYLGRGKDPAKVRGTAFNTGDGFEVSCSVRLPRLSTVAAGISMSAGRPSQPGYRRKLQCTPKTCMVCPRWFRPKELGAENTRNEEDQ